MERGSFHACKSATANLFLLIAYCSMMLLFFSPYPVQKHHQKEKGKEYKTIKNSVVPMPFTNNVTHTEK